MLGKLMKYEFKATSRTFLPMFAALIVVSLVNRLFNTLDLAVPKGISIAISVILMIAIGVATLLIMLQRFNRNLLQGEGYLMQTLPVATEKLILSKLLVSAIWFIASFAVVMLSIFLMAVIDVSFSDFIQVIKDLFSLAPLKIAQGILLIFEALVSVILSMCASILLIYACISLGMLVNNRRGLLSFGAFLAISTAMQILGTVGVYIIYKTELWRVTEDWSHTSQLHLTLIGTSVISLALCTVFFLLTRHMLKRRLNLQ